MITGYVTLTDSGLKLVERQKIATRVRRTGGRPQSTQLLVDRNLYVEETPELAWPHAAGNRLVARVRRRRFVISKDAADRITSFHNPDDPAHLIPVDAILRSDEAAEVLTAAMDGDREALMRRRLNRNHHFTRFCPRQKRRRGRRRVTLVLATIVVCAGAGLVAAMTGSGSRAQAMTDVPEPSRTGMITPPVPAPAPPSESSPPDKTVVRMLAGIAECISPHSRLEQITIGPDGFAARLSGGTPIATVASLREAGFGEGMTFSLVNGADGTATAEISGRSNGQNGSVPSSAGILPGANTLVASVADELVDQVAGNRILLRQLSTGPGAQFVISTRGDADRSLEWLKEAESRARMRGMNIVGVDVRTNETMGLDLTAELAVIEDRRAPYPQALDETRQDSSPTMIAAAFRLIRHSDESAPPVPAGVSVVGAAAVGGETRFALRFEDEDCVRVLAPGDHAFGWSLIDEREGCLILEKEEIAYEIAL